MNKKLVVAAERSVADHWPVLHKIATHAVRYTGGEIAVRGPRAGVPTGNVERQTIEIARICNIRPRVHVPVVSDDARAATFRRDYELVEGADLVLAFFSEGSDMGGGTGHVVKAAIDRGVAVEAFSVNTEGELAFLLDGGWSDDEE